MSKTKGNGIDPTEVTAEYGADALRFALTTASGPGADSRLNLQKVEAARNFGNKLWNAVRFALPTIEAARIEMSEQGPAQPSGELALADRWIVSRLHAVTDEVGGLLANHLYGEAGRQLQEFVWSELCDWYIEAAKVRLRGEPAEQRVVAQTLAYVLEQSLRLLHPFMPFITESLWQELPHVGDSVMVAAWPAGGERNGAAEADFAALMDLVRNIRNARAEANVEPGRWIAATVVAGPRTEVLRGTAPELSQLARIAPDQLTIAADGQPTTEQAIVVVAGELVATLPLAGLIDLDVERARLQRELEAAEAEQQRASAQLANEAFVSRAPEHVVAAQRDRLAKASEQVDVLRRRLGELGG